MDNRKGVVFTAHPWLGTTSTVTSPSWTLPPTPSCLDRKHCFLVRLDPTRVREGRSQGAKRLSHPYVRRAGQEWSAEHRSPRTPLRKAAQQGSTPQCTKDMGREGHRHSVSPNSNPSDTQPQEGRAPHSPPRDDTKSPSISGDPTALVLYHCKP